MTKLVSFPECWQDLIYINQGDRDLTQRVWAIYWRSFWRLEFDELHPYQAIHNLHCTSSRRSRTSVLPGYLLPTAHIYTNTKKYIFKVGKQLYKYKLINFSKHINRLKNRSHTIISKKKVFDEMHHLFMIKLWRD